MKKILIYGKGKTGIAVQKLCNLYQLECTVVDDSDYTEEHLRYVDTVVVSPGIPFFHRIYKDAKRYGKEIIGEIEFAYRFLSRKNKIVAITGTDGKSTTSKLTEHILKSGYRTYLCGNYGVPFSEIVDKANQKPGIVVIELSSFQIYSIKNFNPDIAVFLNFSTDHLDWHRKLKHYFLSKEKLFKSLQSDSFAILNYDNIWVRYVRTNARKIFFSAKEKKDIFIEETIRININKTEFSIENRNRNLIGKHNLQNTAVASAVALILGIDKPAIEKQIETFRPLPHRLEFVKEINGIVFYNDSKSTTVQSLKVALESFDKPVLLIAGGINKGGDFSVLKPILRERVKKIFLIGRDKSEIKDMINGSCNCELCNSLEEATEKAYMDADKGDVILLSPGCASFDMFKSYSHRGEIFKKTVEKLDGKRVLL